MDESAKIDANQQKTLLAVTNAATPEIKNVRCDATTGRVLVSATVSGVSDITVANEATDTSCFPLFATAATGSIQPKTNAGLTFNSSTGVLGAAGLALGVGSITMSGSIGVTGTRVTKGWFTDIESTNIPTVGGTAILSSLTAPQFTTIELGHASDTTIARAGAGQISVEGVNVVTVSSTDNLTNKTLNGSTVQKSYLLIDALPDSDHSCTGVATNTILSGYSSAIGDLVFVGSGGKWLEADADAIATCKGLMGIALEAKNDTEAMLVALPGSFVRDDTWNWTVGATLYAGETLGAISESIPTGADGVVKVIGFAISADVIYFNPSPDHSTVVS